MMFILILGIVLFIGGTISFIISANSWDNSELWGVFGFIGLFFGFILIVVGGLFLKNTSKEVNESTNTITSDSMRISLPTDTIKSIMYVISWKDDDGVWAGRNVKLVGYTEKNVGDTIIINLK